MTQRITIPRTTDSLFEGEGPAWKPALGDGVRVIHVRCARGHVAQLDHDIGSDGTVHPSLVCPYDGCDWHVWGKLEGWSGDPSETTETTP